MIFSLRFRIRLDSERRTKWKWRYIAALVFVALVATGGVLLFIHSTSKRKPVEESVSVVYTTSITPAPTIAATSSVVTLSSLPETDGGGEKGIAPTVVSKPKRTTSEILPVEILPFPIAVPAGGWHGWKFPGRPATRKVGKWPNGIRNGGNLCYMDSALQCLASLPEFADYYKNGDFEDDLLLGAKHSHMSAETSRVLKQLLNYDSNQMDCLSTMDRLLAGMAGAGSQFGQHLQNDGHEFVVQFLDFLAEEGNRIKIPPKKKLSIDESLPVMQRYEMTVNYTESTRSSKIDDLFRYYIKTTIQCNSCGAESKTSFDPVSDFQVVISNSERNLNKLIRNTFTQMADNYTCDNCHVFQDNPIHARMMTTPKLLLVQLKRYYFDRKKVQVVKRPDIVDAPPLDMLQASPFNPVFATPMMALADIGGRRRRIPRKPQPAKLRTRRHKPSKKQAFQQDVQATLHRLPTSQQEELAYAHADMKPASCHQCKTNKHPINILFCSSGKKEKGKRACHKKFCDLCMQKYSSPEYVSAKMSEQRQFKAGSRDVFVWQCPACTEQCTCAGCRRKKKKREAEQNNAQPTSSGSSKKQRLDMEAQAQAALAMTNNKSVGGVLSLLHV